MPILKVGSSTFVSKPAELVDSLFAVGGTANGFYKVRKTGVLFSDMKGEPFAFLVANRFNERFFVSCSRQPDGRIWYGHSTDEISERKLGIAHLSYRQNHEEAARVWASLTGPKAEVAVAPAVDQAAEPEHPAAKRRCVGV